MRVKAVTPAQRNSFMSYAIFTLIALIGVVAIAYAPDKHEGR